MSSRRNRNRGILLLTIQLLGGLLLLIIWNSFVDLAQIISSIRQASSLHVALAIALALSTPFLRGVRWRLLLQPIAKLPLWDVWLIGVASSLINFILPIRSGEIARGLFLKQRHRIPISRSLPTVAIDRSFDLLALLTLGIAGSLAGISIGGQLSAVLLGGGILLALFAAFLLLALAARDRLQLLLSRLLPSGVGAPLRSRLLEILEGVLEGFGVIGRNPAKVLPMLGLSFLAGALDAMVFYSIFIGLGVTTSPVLVLTGYALFALTFIVPGAPAYIGTMEVFGSLIFSGLGVGAAVASSAVVLFHSLNAVVLAVSGSLAIWILGLRPGAAFRSAIGGEPVSSDPG